MKNVKIATYLGLMTWTGLAFGQTAPFDRVAFQGALKTSAGAAVTDGTYKAKIYIKRNGSDCWVSPTWQSITTHGGVFSIELSGTGSTGACSGSLGADHFSTGTMTMNVVVDYNNDGSADDTFAGVPIEAVPIAMMADKATTLSATLPIALGGTGGTSASAARTALGLGSVSTINISNTAGDVLHGDGTWSTPASSLSVVENVGSATGIYAGLNGTTAQFKSLVAGSTALSLSSSATGVTVDVAPSNIAISSLSGTAGVAKGGTGISSFTAGDMMYALSGTSVTTLAIAGTSSQVLRSNGSAPVWASLDVSDVATGTLPVARGGTGNSSFTAGDMMYALSGTSVATIAISGTTTAVLKSTGSAPAWSQLTPNDIKAISAMGGFASTATSATAYTLAQTGFTLDRGAVVTFKMHATNTGAAPTLAVNGTTATVMKHWDGTAIAANDLRINNYYRAYYDGTNWLVEGVGGKYQESGTTSLATTPSWTCGTAPTGASSTELRFMRTGNIATAWIRLEYATAGSACTSVTMAFPTGVPQPVTAFTGTGATEIAFTGAGVLSTTSIAGTSPAAAGYCGIEQTGTLGTYQFRINSASNATKIGTCTVTYPTN
ncbi:MAG: hypothetical protein JST16_12925 [Bdellovibrionales bacterium]|nr:hypothetical protein [Bdellovibrionales bacterium]